MLKEWRKGDRLVYEANPKYKGTNKPFIQKVVVIGAAPSTGFAAYQAGEIDFVSGPNLSPADNDIVSADRGAVKRIPPALRRLPHRLLVLRHQEPAVRQPQGAAGLQPCDRPRWADQEHHQADPGHPGLLVPDARLPGLEFSELSNIQNYDVEAAKKLLAEAGYPDGKGFPKLTLWLRNEAPVRQSLAQAIAASIKQSLGIDVEVSNKETKTFTDAMNAKPTQIQFGMVSYGFDFDPYNMLSVWLSGGRHNWNNTQYDDLVKKAASFTGDPNERSRCSRMPRSCWSRMSAGSSSTIAPPATCTGHT